VRLRTQRERLRRLKPVQTRITINRMKGDAENDQPGLVGLETTRYGVVDDPVRIHRCGGRGIHGDTLAPSCPTYPAELGQSNLEFSGVRVQQMRVP
jgi:hypothetical protein